MERPYRAAAILSREVLKAADAGRCGTGGDPGSAGRCRRASRCARSTPATSSARSTTTWAPRPRCAPWTRWRRTRDPRGLQVRDVRLPRPAVRPGPRPRRRPAGRATNRALTPKLQQTCGRRRFRLSAIPPAASYSGLIDTRSRREETPVTTPAAKELRALSDAHSAHNYHPLPVVISRAEGAWSPTWRAAGTSTCLAAYSAINFGHRHPARRRRAAAARPGDAGQPGVRPRPVRPVLRANSPSSRAWTWCCR